MRDQGRETRWGPQSDKDDDDDDGDGDALLFVPPSNADESRNSGFDLCEVESDSFESEDFDDCKVEHDSEDEYQQSMGDVLRVRSSTAADVPSPHSTSTQVKSKVAQASYICDRLLADKLVYDPEIYFLCRKYHTVQRKQHTALKNELRRKRERELHELPMKLWIYNVLEFPQRTTVGGRFAFFIFFCVLLTVVQLMLETIPRLNPELRPEYEPVWFTMELVITLFFSVELVVRFAVVPSKMMFWRSYLNIMDILAVLPFYFSFFASGTNLDFLKILRLARFVKLFRTFPHIDSLILTLSKIGKSLVAPNIFLFVLVVVVSGALWAVEGGHFYGTRQREHVRWNETAGENYTVSLTELTRMPPPQQPIPAGHLNEFLIEDCWCTSTAAFYFKNRTCPLKPVKVQSIIDAIWYALVTITTVGYGDIVPSCSSGKMLASVQLFMSTIFFAMPIAIVGVSFTESVEEKHFAEYRKKKRSALEIANLRVAAEIKASAQKQKKSQQFKKLQEQQHMDHRQRREKRSMADEYMHSKEAKLRLLIAAQIHNHQKQNRSGASSGAQSSASSQYQPLFLLPTSQQQQQQQQPQQQHLHQQQRRTTSRTQTAADALLLLTAQLLQKRYFDFASGLPVSLLHHNLFYAHSGNSSSGAAGGKAAASSDPRHAANQTNDFAAIAAAAAAGDVVLRHQIEVILKQRGGCDAHRSTPHFSDRIRHAMNVYLSHLMEQWVLDWIDENRQKFSRAIDDAYEQQQQQQKPRHSSTAGASPPSPHDHSQQGQRSSTSNNMDGGNPHSPSSSSPPRVSSRALPAVFSRGPLLRYNPHRWINKLQHTTTTTTSPTSPTKGGNKRQQQQFTRSAASPASANNNNFTSDGIAKELVFVKANEYIITAIDEQQQQQQQHEEQSRQHHQHQQQQQHQHGRGNIGFGSTMTAASSAVSPSLLLSRSSSNTPTSYPVSARSSAISTQQQPQVGGGRYNQQQHQHQQQTTTTTSSSSPFASSGMPCYHSPQQRINFACCREILLPQNVARLVVSRSFMQLQVLLFPLSPVHEIFVNGMPIDFRAIPIGNNMLSVLETKGIKAASSTTATGTTSTATPAADPAMEHIGGKKKKGTANQQQQQQQQNVGDASEFSGYRLRDGDVINFTPIVRLVSGGAAAGSPGSQKHNNKGKGSSSTSKSKKMMAVVGKDDDENDDDALSSLMERLQRMGIYPVQYRVCIGNQHQQQVQQQQHEEREGSVNTGGTFRNFSSSNNGNGAELL